MLNRVKGVKVGPFKVDLEPHSELSLTNLYEEIDRWCGRHGFKFLFCIDEAQYLRFGGGVRYDGLLA